MIRFETHYKLERKSTSLTVTRTNRHNYLLFKNIKNQMFVSGIKQFLKVVKRTT